MKYLNPRADLTFKRIFGEHPDLVMSLLNALLPLKEGEEITEIEYLSPEMVPENPMRKYSIVDVRCKDKQGRQFLVEMQMVWYPEFRQRVLFNASKAYVRQLDKSEQYDLLQPVYSLNLINEAFETKLKGYYHHYAMVHIEHTDHIIEGLELIFIELPKFTPQTFAEKRMQVLWLRFLTEISEATREIPEELLAEPEIKKALDILEESAFSDAELAGYDHFWDMVRTQKQQNSSFERKGKKEGLIEGEAIGIVKGRAEGLIEGVEQERYRTASLLKQSGVASQVIVRCTGLSVEEIEKL